MVSRQTEWQRERRAEGVCFRCRGEVFKQGMCFRCHLTVRMRDRGISSKMVRRTQKAYETFVAGLYARYRRILEDEGFALNAITEPEAVLEAAAFPWARGRLKTKMLAVIAHYDDAALRERFSEEVRHEA